MSFSAINDYGTKLPRCKLCGEPVEAGPVVEVLETELVYLPQGSNDGTIEPGSYATDMDYSECNVIHVACWRSLDKS